MKLLPHSLTATALIATAVAAASGAANADPTTATLPSPDRMHIDLAPGAAFDDDLDQGIATVRTPVGMIAVQSGQFDVRDATGNTVLGSAIDIPAQTAGNGDALGTAPGRTGAHHKVTVAEPAPSEPEDIVPDINRSMAAAAPHMGLGMAVGALGGSLIGIAVGCPFGIATGGTLLSLATAGTMTLPALAAACAVGAVAFGGLGASLGGAAVAIPVGIAAGTQKFNQLRAEHAQTPQADRSR